MNITPSELASILVGLHMLGRAIQDQAIQDLLPNPTRIEDQILDPALRTILEDSGPVLSPEELHDLGLRLNTCGDNQITMRRSTLPQWLRDNYPGLEDGATEVNGADLVNDLSQWLADNPSEGFSHVYHDKDGDPLANCPHCAADLRKPQSVRMTVSTEVERIGHVLTSLDADGGLVDVDGLVAGGHHAGTECAACGEGLDGLEVV